MTRQTVLCVALAIATPPVLTAQSSSPSTTPGWAGELGVISANVLVGGLTAGLRRAFSDGSFGEGFVRGALGGAIGYLGKRTATARFGGAGFVGREIAAVGHSLVRNGSEGRPMLSVLHLPLGPLPAMVELAPRDGWSPRVRVDPVSLAMLVQLSTDSRLHFDASRTLWLGVPVFTSSRRQVIGHDEVRARGSMLHGNVVISDPRLFASIGDVERTMAHEVAHVIQYDFMSVVWSDPLNEKLSRTVGVETVHRFVRVNEAWWAALGIDDLLNDRRGSSSPFELEADWFTR